MSTARRLGSGTLGTSLANIDNDAVPADHIRVVKAISLCNDSTSPVEVTITIAGVQIISGYPLPAKGWENTYHIPFLDQVMHAGERIQGSASAGSAIRFYISGKDEPV